MKMPTRRRRTHRRIASLCIIPAAMIAAMVLLSLIGPDASAATYTVGGTISGLEGSGLVLSLNGGDNLAISADGVFTFYGSLADNDGYIAAVVAQPSSPDQWCEVYNSSGTIAGADVADVNVVCTTGLYNVVDTNQSSCYDSYSGAAITCAGVGYDADYGGSQPSYTLSSDGLMVTDNITGLIWTSKADINNDGVVDINDKLIQPDAAAYCAGLTYGGFTWRLPTIKELYSLMDFTGGDPSGYTGTDTSILTTFINESYFQRAFGDTSAGDRIIDGQVATSTFYVSPLGTMGGNDTMFGVNFVDGRIKGYPYDFPAETPKPFYVHCVTGNTSYGINDFTDNGDGTVSDLATGLMWEQNDYQSTDFEDAVAHCENAATGGHTDWRLPNVKELQSIVDYDRAPDATGSAAIDPIFNATPIIPNEGGQTDWGYYWASTTHATYLGNGRSGTYVSFGRALGYFDPGSGLQVLDVHGAGAQRSNFKMDVTTEGSSANAGYGTFYYHGPQGDILRKDNMVRCVRNLWPDSDGDGTPDYRDPYPSDPDYWTAGSVCGADDGQTLNSTPTNLCNSGTPSTVAGAGPWTWTCSGVTGGPDASCSAGVTSCDQPLKLYSDSTKYGFFTDALSAVTGNDTIFIGPTVGPEDVNIDAPGLTLLLQGGWDCNFANRTGTSSTVQGSITIANGTVEMDEVTIE